MRRIGIGEQLRRLAIDDIGKSEQITAYLCGHRACRIDEARLEDGPKTPIPPDCGEQLDRASGLRLLHQPGRLKQSPRFRLRRIAR